MKPDFLRNAARALAPTRYLGHLALEAGLITERQLADALQEQERAEPRPKLGEILVRGGWLDASELGELLDRQAKLRGTGEENAGPPDGQETLGRLGRFHLVESLGSGGAGDVWKAWDSRLSRWVAVKTLRFPVVAQRERFLREARLTARIQHPHIVPIHEVDQVNGVDYLVMEYKDCVSLDRMMLPLPDGLKAVRHICDATAHLHEAGVVHRDIKPQNILVSRGGEAFLTDLGLARALGTEGITVQGGLLGTPAYMAPEQVHDAHLAGPAADIYALGGVLYFIATHRAPCEGETIEEVLHHLTSRQIPRPRRINPSIPRDVETIILRAMDPDPARRYPTAKAVAEDIDRFLRHEPIQAQPITLIRRVTLSARRNTARVAVAILLVAAAGVTTAILLKNRRDTRIIREDAGKREQEALRLGEFSRNLRLLSEGLARLERLVYEPDCDANRRDNEAETLRREAEMLARRFPESPDPWVSMARASVIRHERKPARRAIDRALELDAHHPLARDVDARLLLSEWAYWFARIEDAERDTDIQRLEVAARLSKAISAGPGNTLLRAYERHFAKDTEGFLKVCNDRIAGGGNIEDFCFLLACVYFVNRDFASADRYLTRALDHAPCMLQALLLRSSCSSLSGKPDEAVKDAERAIRIAPRDAEGYFELGRLRGLARNYEVAVPLLRKAVELNPDFLLPRGMLGGCLSQLKDAGGSEEEFARALAIAPNSTMLLWGRAQARLQRHLLAEAMEDLNRAIDLDPGYEKARTSRARVHLVEKREAEARADIELALKGPNPSGNAHLLKAKFLMMDGNREEARNHMMEARRKGCDFPQEMEDLERQLGR